MKFRMKTTILALGALTLLATVTRAGPDGRRGPRFDRQGQTERQQHARERGAFLRGLEFSDAQRALALQHARAVEPLAREARREALRLRLEARDRQRTGDPEALRADLRQRLQALRERARAEILPHGRVLVAALTPEQRAKIEARLAERGRTFDAERAAARVARWLAAPRTLDRLEARAGR